jgi:N6-adenosine-specific RNA methylase IME4
MLRAPLIRSALYSRISPPPANDPFWPDLERLYGIPSVAPPAPTAPSEPAGPTAPIMPREQAGALTDPSRPLPAVENTTLALDAIAVPPDRLRVLRPEIVRTIAESFAAIGQQQPIVVQPNGSSGHILIAGRHRLEAARALEWPCIAASVVPACSADEALLIEIDENLMRGDLSPAERSAHEDKRKEIYERLHPETRPGGAGCGRGKVRQVGDSINRYTRDAADKTGRSERAIQRDAARAKAIPTIASLARTSLDKGEELDALSTLRGHAPDAAQDLMRRAIAGDKVSAKTALKKVQRDEKEQALAGKILTLPDKRYGVILADPPWSFEVYSRETGLDRAADNHYPTQSLDEIKALDVASIAANDCVLFLWATAPMVLQAGEVLTAWGFTFKTNAIWNKPRAGTGYWFRNKHEHLLVGTRGRIPAPAPGTLWDSVIDAPVGEHSAKPEAFLELIESWYPNTPKIELNRRGPAREGWDSWGLEAHQEAAE